MNYIATACASPNIALIKYWGKAHAKNNTPSTSSLSMTLSGIGTTTTVAFDESMKRDVFTLNGVQDEAMLRRVSKCIDELRKIAGVNIYAAIDSGNNFPTGSGLASSAAGFSALVTATDSALGTGLSKSELSRVARQASGSAARSIFGGFVGLNANRKDPPAEPLFDESYFPLGVAIAVVSRAAKPVSSTVGMQLTQETSDFYDSWVATHDKDMRVARQALEEKNFAALGEVAEVNCMKMHCALMASRPALIYWLPATLGCIHLVQCLRADTDLPVFFTIDAGPQVKVFCLPEALDRVAEELSAVDGVLEVIKTTTGPGAYVVDNP